MVQTFATLASLLIGIAALAVIAFSIAEDWAALKRALGIGAFSSTPPLPPRTRQIICARRARIVRLSVEPVSWQRAA
jgi:hypothetical protein